MKRNRIIMIVGILLLVVLVVCSYRGYAYEEAYLREKNAYVEALPGVMSRAFQDIDMCDHVETEVETLIREMSVMEFFNVELTVSVYAKEEFEEIEFSEKIKTIDDWYRISFKTMRESAKDYPVLWGIMTHDKTRKKVQGRIQEVNERMILHLISSDGVYTKHMYSDGTDGYYKDGKSLPTKECMVSGCHQIVKNVGGEYCKSHSCKFCNNRRYNGSELCIEHKCQKCKEPVVEGWELCRKHKAEAEANYRAMMDSHRRKYGNEKSKPQYGDVDVWDYYEMHKDEFKSYDEAEDAFWDDYE